MKKTGWYNGDQKPVRVGVYERKYSPTHNPYCKWDGKTWYVFASNIHSAMNETVTSPSQHNVQWRGITKGIK